MMSGLCCGSRRVPGTSSWPGSGARRPDPRRYVSTIPDDSVYDGEAIGGEAHALPGDEQPEPVDDAADGGGQPEDAVPQVVTRVADYLMS